ncbi:Fungal specific transcription factor domain-containing protein isoform 2 [Cladophialophora immunda]|nr:Fungal specific transcription factor domain-containing protein isoform 1 [Cladophialophora immunda]OQU99892.1 Fungal specific transcription factor domain-containing protein isoform 2 [Cladophialophora immunda]
MHDNCAKAYTSNSPLGPSWSIPDFATIFRSTDCMDDELNNGESSLSDEKLSEVPSWDDCGIVMDAVERPQLLSSHGNIYLDLGLSADSELTVHAPLDTDPLSPLTHEIVGRLRETISHKPRNSYITLQWSYEVENQCLEFFCPENIRRFVDLYWLTWYIHWPVIHKSTFQISETPCTLIAAMVLIGASYSTIPHDRAIARTYCDGVEEIVFGDEYFGDSTAFSVLNAACLERRLRSLQAAHAMCLFQAWEGAYIAKQRARRHRFGLVVAMARELGFAHASHGDLGSLTESNFNWKEFILKEELIRTLNYMVVLDCGFIIMNNMPPRVFVSELEADLACPEACFQATSASECFSYLQVWLSHPSASAGRISILDAVEQLGRKDMDWEKLQVFTHLAI